MSPCAGRGRHCERTWNSYAASAPRTDPASIVAAGYGVRKLRCKNFAPAPSPPRMNTKGENRISRRNGAEIRPGALDQRRFDIHALSGHKLTFARWRQFDGASSGAANDKEVQS